MRVSACHQALVLSGQYWDSPVQTVCGECGADLSEKEIREFHPDMDMHYESLTESPPDLGVSVSEAIQSKEHLS